MSGHFIFSEEGAVFNIRLNCGRAHMGLLVCSFVPVVLSTVTWTPSFHGHFMGLVFSQPHISIYCYLAAHIPLYHLVIAIIAIYC